MAGIILPTVITEPPLYAGLIWNSNDIIQLKAALASGVLMVVYAGPPQRSVTYQSMAAMEALLARMIRDVFGSSRSTLARVRKGFRDADEE